MKNEWTVWLMLMVAVGLGSLTAASMAGCEKERGEPTQPAELTAPSNSQAG